MKKDLDHQTVNQHNQLQGDILHVIWLTKAGFTFEGWYPEDNVQIPLDYARYPNHWCFHVLCLGCQLRCRYCYNEPFLYSNKFIFDDNYIEQIRQNGPINTFSYTVGEPECFIDEIKSVIQRYPSDQFRHCVKTNGSFMSDELVEDIYAINTDIKGVPSFYDYITQHIDFFENIVEPQLQWLSEITIPVKEITYSIWLWHNDDEDTRQFVLKYVDHVDARLVLNFIRSTETFDAGYDRSLLNKDVYERVRDIYLWFKDYGIEPFVCNFRNFDPNKEP